MSTREQDDDFLAGYEFFRKFMSKPTEEDVTRMGVRHPRDFAEGMRACENRDYSRYNRILP